MADPPLGSRQESPARFMPIRGFCQGFLAKQSEPAPDMVYAMEMYRVVERVKNIKIAPLDLMGKFLFACIIKAAAINKYVWGQVIHALHVQTNRFVPPTTNVRPATSV